MSTVYTIPPVYREDRSDAAPGQLSPAHRRKANRHGRRSLKQNLRQQLRNLTPRLSTMTGVK